MEQTAITYPQTSVNELTGVQIKAILEDVADNVFHPDPYLRQGGDMVRVGGMTYAIEPAARDRRAHLGHENRRQAAGARQALQGGRLGARGRGRERRACVGRGEPLPALAKARQAAAL